MTSTVTDRIDGVSTSTAIKAPVRVATTAAITLSGEQTIDGVACVTGDRVLVKNQATASANGIYDVDTGTWTRATDFDGNRDVLQGTIVMVQNGTTNSNTYWRISTANPITIGTTSIAFAPALSGDATLITFLQSGASSVARTMQDKARDIVNVRDKGGATIALVRTALEEHRGNTVELNAEVISGSTRLLIGGTAATDYHSLKGKGPAIYSNNSATPRTILNFTSGHGVLIDKPYQRTENFAVIGVAQGGSDPTTRAVADLKNIGFAISGGTQHGGYSVNEDISVSGFDTGISDAGGFHAYSRLTGLRAFSNVTGFAMIGSSTDTHFSNLLAVDNTTFGWYQCGATRFSISDSLFETSGSTTATQTSAAIRLDDQSQLVLVTCGLQDDTNYFAGRDARMELIGCNPVTANKFFGPGEFIFHNSLGRAIDVPALDLNLWSLTNITEPVWTDTATYPACWLIRSTSGPASVQMFCDIPISMWGDGLDKRSISYYGTDDVRHYVHAEFEIEFPTGFHSAPTGWTAAAGFQPALQVFGFDGSSDSFEAAVDTHAAAWTFTDNTRWRVNLIFPITWSAAALNDTISYIRMALIFSDGATVDYSVNNLNCYITQPKITFYQRNYGPA